MHWIRSSEKNFSSSPSSKKVYNCFQAPLQLPSSSTDVVATGFICPLGKKYRRSDVQAAICQDIETPETSTALQKPTFDSSKHSNSASFTVSGFRAMNILDRLKEPLILHPLEARPEATERGSKEAGRRPHILRPCLIYGQEN